MTLLMVYDGDSASGAVTRTGGVPLVPAGFGWPVCRTCGGALQFLAQVWVNEAGVGGGGLLSIFMCANDPGMCDEWDAGGGGNRAYLFDPAGGLGVADVPAGDRVLLAECSQVRLVPWAGGDYDQAREEWPVGAGRSRREVLGQLGGAPAWIQGDETPSCPSCGVAMSFVVQLEEGHRAQTGANFGGGSAYGFSCAACTTAAFLWQQ